MSHFAPFSATSLVPLACARTQTCTLSGFNGNVVALVEDEVDPRAVELRGGLLMDHTLRM
jgi:hypothetical protein